MIEGIRGTGVIEFHNGQKFEPLHVLVASTEDLPSGGWTRVFHALVRERVGWGRGE
jgi:hypothetical protein